MSFFNTKEKKTSTLKNSKNRSKSIKKQIYKVKRQKKWKKKMANFVFSSPSLVPTVSTIRFNNKKEQKINDDNLSIQQKIPLNKLGTELSIMNIHELRKKRKKKNNISNNNSSSSSSRSNNNNNNNNNGRVNKRLKSKQINKIDYFTIYNKNKTINMNITNTPITILDRVSLEKDFSLLLDIKLQFLTISGFMFLSQSNLKKTDFLGGHLVFMLQKRSKLLKNNPLTELPKDKYILHKTIVQYNYSNETISYDNNKDSLQIFFKKSIFFNSETLISVVFIPISKSNNEITISTVFKGNLMISFNYSKKK